MKSYITLGVLVLLIMGALGLYFFVLLTDSPQTEEHTTSNVEAADSSAPVATSSTEIASSTDDTTVHSSSTTTLSGVFLSLQEVQTEWRTSYMTLLLDDGTEIMRIDLRPLLGNDVRDVSDKLGVERGQRVEIKGNINDEGYFRASTIEAVAN